METLCLLPAMELPRDQHDAQAPVFLAAELCSQSPRDVWLVDDGGLVAVPQGHIPSGEKGRLLFSLSCLESTSAGQGTQREWVLLRRDRLLQVNGIPVLPLASLEPGQLLAVGTQRWLVASLWKPTPHIAPESVMNSNCPVCGAPLSAALVVQCPCGRYMHLEKCDEPDNPQLLNCYLLAGTCGLCGRPPSLEPSLLPEPDETLVAAESVRHTLCALAVGAS